MRCVWIGLGANVGDPAANVLAAATALGKEPALRGLRVSALYESAPWGKPDQPWFVNAVAEAETDLEPVLLLRRLLAIETGMGRIRQERWGPRIIDLDYLLDDGRAVESAELNLPHPELENRAFVLAPLAELRPELILPSGRAIGERLAELLPSQALRPRDDVPRIRPCLGRT